MSMSITVCSGCVCKQSSSTWRIIRASSSSSAAPPSVNFTSLHSAILKKDSDAVKEALDQLREVGWAKRWSSQPYVSRRTTSLRELTTLGIQNAENLAIPSVRNDAAFLFTVVGTTGFLGILAGQLPGDWGFFVPYLIGSISLVVLAVGSISPGLLQAAIGGFSTFFPDYQDRIARHEAAHFLERNDNSELLVEAFALFYKSDFIHFLFFLFYITIWIVLKRKGQILILAFHKNGSDFNGQFSKEVCFFINKYISMKKDELSMEKISQGEEEGVDLLTAYLKEDHDMGIGLKTDDKFLRDTILNFMIAGRDTTSSALTWFIWLVSTHPDVESKIREELNEAIPTEDGNKWRLFSVQEVSKLVFVQEVSKLVYLHSAICETLRLYPPVPFQHKEPIHADTLPSGHRIHPKMKIFFSLYAMGRMNFIWGDDCLDFKPERWITERGTVKHEPSYKFLAFNAGPRTCLGKEVAFTQMKTVAAAIINNYNVELVEGHRVAPNNSIILYMKRGLKAKLTKRW